MNEKVDIKDLTREELTRLLCGEGFPKFSPQQVFNWIYKKREEDFSSMSDLSKKLRDYLKDNMQVSSITMKKHIVSKDKTEKFIFELFDGHIIETALIPGKNRNTICLSTQVGCKFGCSFCVSGLEGFRRNLNPAEIINQYLKVSDFISSRRVTNIVFMGIGEPLDNLDNLIKSIKIFTDGKGIYIGKRKISVSTCGLTPQIYKLADSGLGVQVSVSLHSADNHTRTKIMPINKIYPIPGLIESVRYYVRKFRFPVTFVYILIKGFNTSSEQALKLARLVKGIDCKINLIPYNKHPGFKWQEPDSLEADNFQAILKEKKVFFTLRKPRGQDIKAACGQLKADFLK